MASTRPLRRAGRWSCLPALPLLLVLLAPWWAGCRTAPVSGRRQLLLVPESQEIELGKQAYEQILQEEPPSQNAHYVELVRRVGQRIAAVADRPDYDWEFNVIDSDQANAFALPGGKVAFYEGILPVCRSEAGIAVVMSHEIAHALLRHGGERMSHSALEKGLGKAIELGTREQDEQQRKLLLGAYGVVSKYGVVLPYSRKQETEADEVGLLLMARAGYDPEEAPRFWERFAGMKQGQAPPEFLSTHPSDTRRAENLRKLLPKAVALYAQAPERHGSGSPIRLANGDDAPREPGNRRGVSPAGFDTAPADRAGR